MTVGWGIIGIGTHVEDFMASAFTKAENTRLVDGWDIDPARVKSFASQYDIKKVYDSYEEMLQDPQLDAVYIATPNHLHAEHTVKAAEARKHVLCEKPMALTVNDCERMIEACEKNHVNLAIDFQSRVHPVNMEARRLVAEGIIGDITVAKGQGCHSVSELSKAPSYPGAGAWRMDPGKAGAGALMGVGIHTFDRLRFVMNAEIEEVTAICDPQEAGVLDDMEYAILKFTNGTRGVVITGVKVPRSDNGIVLYGDKAKLTAKTIRVGTPGDELTVEGDSINIRASFPTNLNIMVRGYILMIEDFNRCITENIESISSGLNGLQMVKVTNAILESSRTGKGVRVK